ncbi:MAG TPA: hypothetical protein VH370_27645 [Humisphaera sp.]|jgi:hypothetical protein|nr:hypothetical protein [Humisphaera sp.]
MPDRTRLSVGDQIRILSVPKSDFEQRERERRQGLSDAGYTADTIERIIAQHPIVTIDRIDEHGFPWFDCDLEVNGQTEFHSLAIMDDESWERIAPG